MTIGFPRRERERATRDDDDDDDDDDDGATTATRVGRTRFNIVRRASDDASRRCGAKRG